MKKFFGLFTGRDNTDKMFAAESSLGRHTNATKEQSPWTLTPQEKRDVDERLLQIRVPCDFDWYPKKLFSKPTLPYMKCSDWKKVFCNFANTRTK